MIKNISSYLNFIIALIWMVISFINGLNHNILIMMICIMLAGTFISLGYYCGKKKKLK